MLFLTHAASFFCFNFLHVAGEWVASLLWVCGESIVSVSDGYGEF